MEPLQKIDAVFFFIKKSSDVGAMINDNYIWGMYVNKTSELEISRLMLIEILQKLVEDGYVRRVDHPDGGSSTYHITFKGLIFEGYEKERENLNRERDAIRNLERANARRSNDLNQMTAFIAFGTIMAAAYYWIEIVRDKETSNFFKIGLSVLILLMLIVFLYLGAKKKQR